MKIYNSVREYIKDCKVGDIIIFPPETETLRPIEQFRKVNASIVDKVDDKVIHLHSSLNSDVVYYYSIGRGRKVLVITQEELNKLEDYH